MSDSEIKRQWRPDAEGPEESSTSKNYALSGKIMLTSILILFVVVIFLVLLHLYARWYLLRHHRHNNTSRRRNRRNRSSRIIFHVDHNQLSSPTGGLQSSVLNSLPAFVYLSKNDENEENSPECAVCLAEFEDGEKGRLLPKCKHSFHTECIDMWFFSHSTCPLCRSPVEPVEIEPELKLVSEHGSSSEVTQATSLADRRKGIDVRIDIPSRNELLTETELPSQGFKSPGSRLMSFKRIINMSRKSPAVSPSSGVGPSSLPVAAESDLESTMQESEHESTRSETVIFR